MFMCNILLKGGDRMLLRGIKMRLLPTPEQEQLMFKTANVVRSVWNKMLEINIALEEQREKTLSAFDMKYYYTGCRKYGDIDVEYMRSVSQTAIHQVFFDIEEAYKRYRNLRDPKHPYTTKVLQRCKKQNREPRITERKYHPQFKRKKDSKIAFADRSDNCYFNIKKNQPNKVYVILSKVGWVEIQTDYVLCIGKKACKIYNPRISYEHGKWIFSCALEYENQVPKLHDYSLGVDLNVGNLAVVSYNFSMKNKFYGNPNKASSFKKLEEQLIKYQQRLSNCYKINGKNADDPKIKYRETRQVRKLLKLIRKLYRKLRNKRKDYIHKMTREIVNLLPWRIVLEDLNVEGMKHNHRLAKVISEANFTFIQHCLMYKAEELDIEIIVADRWYPSSKTCCFCGEVNKNLTLGDRTCTCSLYNTTIDRDLNAAINLEWYEPTIIEETK